MEPATYDFCTKIGYVALALLFAGVLIAFYAIWMRSYWRERDAAAADGAKLRIAEKRFQRERENWIGIISDLHDQIDEKQNENSVLKSDNERLKKLLEKSEELRKESK